MAGSSRIPRSLVLASRAVLLWNKCFVLAIALEIPPMSKSVARQLTVDPPLPMSVNYQGLA
jgi:hypothetical protein